MVDVRPIDNTQLDADGPLSVDVVRDCAQNAIHIYRDRGYQILSTCVAGLTSSATGYTDAANVMEPFRVTIPPWTSYIAVYGLLSCVISGASARMRVGWIYGPAARASAVFPTQNADWDINDHYLIEDGHLSISKLVDNNPNFTGEVTMEIKCINDCEILALSIFGVPRG